MNKVELLPYISNEIKAKRWSKKPFNIFNACGVEHRELTHSAFIANLLNPQGTHGCGNIFLQDFIERLGKKKNIDKDILGKFDKDVWVDTEHHLGKYGRIDIWIKSKTQKAYLLIENKIYAKDQDKQIIEYSKYLKEQSKANKIEREGVLLYLTLNKKKPEDYSEGTCYTISYHDEIKSWLNYCKDNLPNKADDANAVRVFSAIVQYLELIDYLVFKIDLTNKLIEKSFTESDIKKALEDNKINKSDHDKEIEEILKYFKYKLKANKKSETK